MTRILVFLSMLINTGNEENVNQDILQTWLLTDHTQSKFTFGDDRADILKFTADKRLELHDLRKGEMRVRNYSWNGLDQVQDEAGKTIMSIKSIRPNELIVRRFVMNGETKIENEMVYHPVPKTVTAYDKKKVEEILAENTWEWTAKKTKDKPEMIIRIGEYEGEGDFPIQQKIVIEDKVMIFAAEVHQVEEYLMLRVCIPNDLEELDLEYLDVENYGIKKMTEDQLTIDLGLAEVSTFSKQ